MSLRRVVGALLSYVADPTPSKSLALFSRCSRAATPKQFPWGCLGALNSPCFLRKFFFASIARISSCIGWPSAVLRGLG